LTVPLSRWTWQALRVLARQGTATGRELRHSPSRQSKDGAFLKRLVDAGLVAAFIRMDDPFASSYRLTALGAHAAEYGEFQSESWRTPL
jgi:DNA-binding HxlR family transcriptional regulator